MTRQERLDIGEKIFVGAFVGSIVVEVLLTVFAVTLNPAWNTLLPWTILVLGTVFVGFLCYLANWLYSGNRTAWTTALGFAAFQIVLAVSVVVGILADRRFAAYFGEPLIWLAIIKAVTYAAFAGFLALPKSVHDFLGLRRGEIIADDTPAVEPPVAVAAPAPVEAASSAPLPLTDDQAAAFGSLATWMCVAACLLVAAGLLRVFVGLYNMEPTFEARKWLPGVPSLLDGLAAVALGVVLFAPAAAVKLVKGREMNRLVAALQRLQALYFVQLILIGVAAIAVVVGIVTRFI